MAQEEIQKGVRTQTGLQAFDKCGNSGTGSGNAKGCTADSETSPSGAGEVGAAQSVDSSRSSSTRVEDRTDVLMDSLRTTLNQLAGLAPGDEQLRVSLHACDSEPMLAAVQLLSPSLSFYTVEALLGFGHRLNAEAPLECLPWVVAILSSFLQQQCNNRAAMQWANKVRPGDKHRLMHELLYVLRINSSPSDMNDEGVKVARGTRGKATKRFYCGRQLPDTEGRCGPDNGLNCPSCQRYTMQNGAGRKSDQIGAALPSDLSPMAVRQQAIAFNDCAAETPPSVAFELLLDFLHRMPTKPLTCEVTSAVNHASSSLHNAAGSAMVEHLCALGSCLPSECITAASAQGVMCVGPASPDAQPQSPRSIFIARLAETLRAEGVSADDATCYLAKGVRAAATRWPRLWPATLSSDGTDDQERARKLLQLEWPHDASQRALSLSRVWLLPEDAHCSPASLGESAQIPTQDMSAVEMKELEELLLSAEQGTECSAARLTLSSGRGVRSSSSEAQIFTSVASLDSHAPQINSCSRTFLLFETHLSLLAQLAHYCSRAHSSTRTQTPLRIFDVIYCVSITDRLMRLPQLRFKWQSQQRVRWWTTRRWPHHSASLADSACSADC